MPSIDDLISKLEKVEKLADSANIKINKIGTELATKNLTSTRDYLKSNSLANEPIRASGKDFNSVMQNFHKVSNIMNTLLEDLSSVTKTLGTLDFKKRNNVANLSKALTDISDTVNSVVAAGKIATRLNKILGNQKGLGLESALVINPDDLLSQQSLGRYRTKSVPKSMGGGTISVFGSTVSAGIKKLNEILYHEIGHAFEETLRQKGLATGAPRSDKLLSIAREGSEYWKPDFYSQHMKPLLGLQPNLHENTFNQMKSLGYDNLVSQQKANYTATTSEIFARNFSSFAQTGKTINPELQGYMERIFENMSLEFKQLLQNVSKQVSSIKQEALSTFDAPTKKAQVGRQLKYQFKEDVAYSGEETPQEIVKQVELSIDQLNRMMEVGRTRSAVKTGGTGAVTGGAQPNYLNNYYDTLDKELQNRLTTYLTGKSTGGMPTQQRATELAKQILGGEVTGGRRRIGGGARVNLDSIMNEINEIIDTTIRQSIEIRKAQYLEQLTKSSQKTGFGAPGTLTGEVIPVKDEKTQTVAGKEAEKLAASQQKAAQNLEVFTRKYIGLSKVLESLGVDLTKLQQLDISSMRVLNDDFKKFTLTVKDLENPTQKVTLYLDQLFQVLTEAQYKKAIGAKQPIPTPQTRGEVEAQLGQFRSNRLLQFAGQYGFGAENLKKLYTQQPTGVTVGKFEFVDENTKAVSQLEVTVDRYGNTLTRTNKRLLGFTDAIVRNTQEVLRWSIGVGLVYGTMYRLQELVKIAIDNETKLADIAVVLGDAQRDVNTIFEEAATVANETGESINAVLETYSLAYRAVGAITDPVERTNSAIQLLTDSTILNKLSTLDAATSIDVLAGSLRQLQQPGETAASAFSKGTDLLDKWVAITRRANVDLATLATAFSITSESAENSGVSIAQLNGIIASLAEKIGGLGGRETGNAVRALIGGVYQQQASEVLTQYGIAVQDTTGKMRPFLDISKEIYDLYKGGVISADELNKIGYTLGGGVRRGQQYVAFLSDFERIQELANLQTTAAGSAQEALGRKLDTTQTSLTRMSNAFQSLAQTLGTKGGVLDSFNGILNVVILLADALNKVTSLLGGLTIPATLLGITGLMFSGAVGGQRLGAFQANIGGKIQGATQKTAGLLPGYRQPMSIATSEGFVQSTKAEQIGIKAGTYFGKYASGILISSMPAITRALQGDFSGAGVSLGGAVVGTILAAGNPIGGLIGSIIAETILEVINRNKTDFADIIEYAIDQNKPEGTSLLKGGEKDIRKMSVEEQQEALRQEVFGKKFKATTFTAEEADFGYRFEAFVRRLIGQDVTAKELAYQDLSEEQRTKLREFGKTNIPVEVDETLMTGSKVRADTLLQIEKEKKLVEDIIELREEELRIQSAMGEIKPKEQLEAQKVLQGLDATLAKLYLAYGETFDKIDNTIQGTEEVYNAFTDILISGTQEQKDELVQAATEWETYTALIEKAKLTGKDIKLPTGEEITIGDAETRIAEIQEMYAEYSKLLRQEQELGKAKLPTVVGLDLGNLQDWEKVYAEAAVLQQEYFDKAIEEGFMNEAQSQIMIERADKLFVQVGDLAGYRIAEGITDSRFLTEAVDKLKDELSTVSIGFQEFDVPLATVEKLAAQSIAIGKQWESLYGYKPEIEEQLVIDPEGLVKPVKADWKITNYLLQQILDTEKKQLDGIYNLPEGAGFYVPYQTLDLAYQKGLNEAAGQMPTGEAGDLTNLPPYKVEESVVQKAYADALKAQTVNKALERDKLTEGVYSKPSKTYLPYVSIPADTLKSMTRGDITKQEPTFWDSIKKLFEDVKNIPWDAGSPAGTISKEMDFKTLFDSLSSKLSTTFNLNLNSTTTLLVDGRVLAEVVKNYLHEDMVRYENTAGAINRTVAI